MRETGRRRKQSGGLSGDGYVQLACSVTWVAYESRSTAGADSSYWVYQIARACQALTMGDTTRALSERHARQIIAMEEFFHIDIELALQHFVMKREWLLVFFNKCVVVPATHSR